MSRISETCSNGALVEMIGVSKQYKDVKALDQVDLQLRAGEIVGLLGPNGAGKTTLMRIILGLARPREGSVTDFGNRNSEKRNNTRLNTNHSAR